MARKFFNQKVNSTRKTVIQIVIICVCIIGIIICFVIANYFNNKASEKAIIELRDMVFIEVNSELPDKTTLFSSLENVKEDEIKVSYADVDPSKVGEYPITLKIFGKKYKTKILVVDTISPDLTLKNINIEKGESYKANDFVESCNDNGSKCDIKFYDLAIDQDGNKIDYASYKDVGTYKIQIIAMDASENVTIQESTLTIGNGTSTKPTTCKYGNNEYDTNKYILATDITDNGCALDLNLYQDSTILKSTEKIMDNETEKLKKEFSKLNVDGAISLNRNAVAVINSSGKGIVGYTINMEVTVTKDNNVEKVVQYSLDQNGKRVYTINKYNLQ